MSISKIEWSHRNTLGGVAEGIVGRVTYADGRVVEASVDAERMTRITDLFPEDEHWVFAMDAVAKTLLAEEAERQAA
jgi:hypothetical protein